MDRSLPHRLVESNGRILAGLRRGEYDWLDLGTNDGGGFRIGERLGGRQGVGIELEPTMAQRNLDEGRDVICGDVRLLPPDITGLRFGVCSHILEHLPNLYDAGSVLAALAALASDYILICGPNFDSEDYLYKHNLKLLHTAMGDHLCRFKTIELINMLYHLGLRDFVLAMTFPIVNSSNIWIHRADAPSRHLWTWDEKTSLPKPDVTFSETLYRDFVCVVKLREEVDCRHILDNFFWGYDKIAFTSSYRY